MDLVTGKLGAQKVRSDTPFNDCKGCKDLVQRGGEGSIE